MRLVTYRTATGPGDDLERWGVLVDEGIIDLTGTAGLTSVKEWLAHDEVDLAQAVAQREPDLVLSDATLLAPITNPGKILAIGLNYAEHRAEGTAPETAHPTVFTRFSDSHVAHGEKLRRPSSTEAFDYEGELAVIVGKPAFEIGVATAMEHVGGYSIYNEASVRDWQMHTSQFIPGKNFYRSGSFGPCMVTADAIDDISAQTIETRVNGRVVQHAFIEEMIFPIPELIAYVSSFTPLSAGDVILTGTPAGVGVFQKPPLLLTAGDVVEVEVSSVGLLSNVVADAVDLDADDPALKEFR